MSFEKLSGGPGSGVTGNNTDEIGLPESSHVSVGSRKALLDNMYFRKKLVRLSDITHVSQKRYVPEKLKKFLADPEIITASPIDVLQVEGPEDLHLIDGHHRYLAALVKKIPELEARVRVKSKKTFTKTSSAYEDEDEY